MRKFTNFLKLLSVSLFVFSLNASAQPGSPITYGVVGSVQTYSVPVGIFKVIVDAMGASGGLNSNNTTYPDRGGFGGCVHTVLNVSPGQVLYIWTGGAGGNATTAGGGTGGANGGGPGGLNSAGSRNAGGGGGGASDVRLGGTALSDRVVVAGGGGGAGLLCASGTPDAERGGDGGVNSSLVLGALSDASDSGKACWSPSFPYRGGQAGGTSAGGAGGSAPSLSQAGLPGFPGTLGIGGGGDHCCNGTGNISAGGGGGGGYYGGGGGQWTGGGGGSSYTSPTLCVLDSTSHTKACNSGGNGLVTITPICNLQSITGPTTEVCNGRTITLSDARGGGSWTTGNPAIATVVALGANAAVVTGTGAGTVDITFTSGPCSTFRTVTVDPLPSPITGGDSVCTGLTITLADVDGPGTWSSFSPYGSIDLFSGEFRGISTGTVLVSYTLPTTCLITLPIRVDPIPSTITGVQSVCFGLTTSLSSASPLGSWLSSDPFTASVDASGVVTGAGVTGGLATTALITYTLPTTCLTFTTVTVNPLPGGIIGIPEVCAGLTTSLTDPDAGGVWTSGTTTIATVGSGNGVVFGVAPGPGTSVITYTLPTSCIATSTVTVHDLPLPIIGPTHLCLGLTTTLSDMSPGGGWSSFDPLIALIDPFNGGVAGAGVGSTTITYTNALTGCLITASMTVDPLPSPITGSPTVCQGSTITLSEPDPGGSWSSSNHPLGSIDATTGGYQAYDPTGGVLPSLDTITYTFTATGCIMTKTVEVSPSTPIIGIVAPACAGYTVSLSDATNGGTWGTTNPTLATIDPIFGYVVYGPSSGLDTITWTTFNGAGLLCQRTATVNVIALSPITGITQVCVGLTSSLSDMSAGGIWSSSNTAVATVGSTGVVSGLVPGTSSVCYSLPSGCVACVTFTVNPLPLAIIAPTYICTGATTTLSDPDAGGTWSSSNSAVATLGSLDGSITGTFINLSSHTLTITYTLPTGCINTKSLTVQPFAPITGPLTVCVSSCNTTLANIVTGGTWTSSNTANATIGTNGVVCGLTVGTTLISYQTQGGCVNTRIITVVPLPVPITVPASVICAGPGNLITYTDGTTGGSWSNYYPGVGTINATGDYYGFATGGIDSIIYTQGPGCTVGTTVQVLPIGPILGPSAVCLNATMTLSDAIPGGTWASGNTVVATVTSTTGVVTGQSSGVALLTYHHSNGCEVITVITVLPLPPAIVTPTSVCVGLSITLSDAEVGGGTWTSSNTNLGLIGSSSGILPGGPLSGLDTIKFTSNASGCFVTRTVTVFSLAPITGPGTVCVGSCVTLSDIATGGSWTPGTLGLLATLGNTTGIFCSASTSTGTARITYSLPSGCASTRVMTVNPNPAPISVPGGGSHAFCDSATISFIDPSGIPGSYWTTSRHFSDTLMTAITTATVIGTIPGPPTTPGGLDTVFFVLPTGCFASTTVTVNPRPDVIIAPGTSVCAGSPITFSDASAGGAWSSDPSMPGTISISPVTGIGTVGLGAGGQAVVIYSLTGTGCARTDTINVDPLFRITGPGSVCVGSTITLVDGVPGGTWESSNTLVATIDGLGEVTPVSSVAGTTMITFTTPAGCIRTRSIAVWPLPSPIVGSGIICSNTCTTLSSSSSCAGSWASDYPSIASVGSTGVVCGQSGGGGSPVISFTDCHGCQAFLTMTVNNISLISGSNTVCVGDITSLSDPLIGGTWSRSNGSGSININPFNPGGGSAPFGIVNGQSAGTATVTYTSGFIGGCFTTYTMSVLPRPNNLVSPSFAVCAGSTLTMSESTPGGTWSSTNTLASIPPGPALPGVVTAIFPAPTGGGLDTIIYTGSNGCIISHTVMVNETPQAIRGASNVCVGYSTTLSNDLIGGAWSSSSPGNGSISGSGFTPGPPPSQYGVITGVSPGSTVLTYSMTATGCRTQRTITIDAVPNPITGPSQVCVGSTITMSDITLGGTWSAVPAVTAIIGPANGVVTGQPTAGTATISYTLANSCYVLTTVTVLALPVSLITPLTTLNLCPGGFVTLTGTTGAAFNYQWYNATAGLTPIPGATNATYTVTDPGIYTIPSTIGNYRVMIRSGSTSCQALSPAVAVTVNPITATITGGGSAGCSAAGVLLQDIAGVSTPGYSYQWLNGGVPIPGASAAAYNYLAYSTGSYQLVETNTFGCSDTSNALTATVNPTPLTTITISGPTTFCSGGSVAFSASPATGLRMQWYNSGSPISGATDSAYTASATGTYSLVATNGFGCTGYSAGIAVTVLPLPSAAITNLDPIVFCSGGGANIRVLPAAVPALSGLQWYNGTTLIPGATNATYFGTGSGTYKALLTAGNGCTAYSNDTDLILLAPPIIVPLSATSFCWGGSALLSTAVVSGPASINYSWYYNGVLIPGAVGPSYTATVPGLFTCRVTLTALGCSAVSSSTTITQYPLPDPLVTFDGTLFHTQNTFVTYQWYYNNVPIPGANSSSTAAIGNGNYKVGVTDTNGCQSISDIKTLSGWVTNSVPTITANDVRVYPNPAQTMVHIESPADVHVTLSSIDGKVLKEVNTAWEKEIDITSLADGFYMISIYDGNGLRIKSEKLVKRSN